MEIHDYGTGSSVTQTETLCGEDTVAVWHYVDVSAPQRFNSHHLGRHCGTVKIDDRATSPAALSLL